MYAGPRPGQGQPPWIAYSLRDILAARAGQIPSGHHLGCRGSALKPAGEIFQPFGDRLEPFAAAVGQARGGAAGFRRVASCSSSASSSAANSSIRVSLWLEMSPIAASLPAIIRPRPATWSSSPSAQATVKLRPPIGSVTLLMTLVRQATCRAAAVTSSPPRATAHAFRQAGCPNLRRGTQHSRYGSRLLLFVPTLFRWMPLP